MLQCTGGTESLLPAPCLAIMQPDGPFSVVPTWVQPKLYWNHQLHCTVPAVHHGGWPVL